MKSKLTGLIAAPCTPMHEDSSINLDCVPDYADHLRKSGVSGVFINGTTGEGLSLTPQERLQLTEAWSKVCGPDLKLIVHVGDNALPVSQELAAYAAQVGAAAIGAMPPSFFKFGIRELADWCAAVSEAAPDTPFYYYHIPSMTGVAVRMVDLFSHIGRIPSFAGVKFTDEDVMDYQMAIEAEGGHFDVLFGRDEILLSGLAVGATGAVGSTYNYMAPVYLKIIDAFAKRRFDIARKWQGHAHQVVRLLQHAENGVACGKAILNLCGVNVGPCRLPLPQYTNVTRSELRESLEKIGFFSWRDGESDKRSIDGFHEIVYKCNV